MRKVRMTILLWVVFVFAAVQSVQADFVLSGVEHLDVVAPHTRGDLYDFSSADVLDNGLIAYAYVNNSALLNVTGGLVVELYTHDSSSANISGGRTTHLYAEDSSTANLLTGANVGQLYAYDSSTVNIFDNISSGGGDRIYAYGDSTVNISGGRLNSIYGYDDSSITFHGYDFQATGGLYLIGESVMGTGRLSGRWFDGTSWGIDIPSHNPSATILAVPEPATLLLLGLGAVMMRIRKH